MRSLSSVRCLPATFRQFPSIFTSALLASILPTFSLTARAQSQLQVKFEDEYHHVVKVTSEAKFFLEDSRLRKAYGHSMLIPADHFKAVGFVQIRDVEITEDQLRSRGSATKNAANDYFLYKATLLSDVDLKDAYCALTFSLGSSPSLRVESIGRLTAGKPKKLKFKVGSSLSSIGRLHLFSEGEEVRSSEVPEPYHIQRDEYAKFVQKHKGIPLGTLWGNQARYPYRLSPSGRYMATFVDDGKTNRILVFDLEEKSLENEIEMGEYYQSIYSLNWLDEERFLFIVDQRLRLARRGSDEVEDLQKNVYSIASMMPKDPDRILLQSEKSNLYLIYDLRSKRTEEKARIGEYSTVWFDTNGVSRIKEVIKDDRVEFFHRHSLDDKWRPLDELVTQEGLQFNYTGASALHQTVFIQDFSANPDLLYVYYNDDSTTNKLAEFSVSQGRITRILLANPSYDLGGLDYVPDSSLLWSSDESQVLGARYTTDRRRVKWFHPDFEAIQKAFDSVNPNTVNIPVAYTDDGSVVVFQSSSEKHPGKYWVFKPFERIIYMLIDSWPPVKDYELGDMQSVRYAARDGYEIRGYLTTPPGYDGQSALPTVVLPHGGPWARDVWGYDRDTQYFATRGYAVFQPNYRGSVGYGTQHMHSGIGNIDTVMVDDVADGVRHFMNEGVFDPSRIFIMGYSFGGYSVYMGLIKYPELYKAGVAVCAVSDYGKQVGHRRNTGDFAYQFWKAALGSHKDKALMERVSPVFRAREIRAPLRIYHGKYDYIVPVEQAEIMDRALSKTSVDYKVTYFDYEGHSFRYAHNVARLLDEADTLFQEVSRKQAPPSTALVPPHEEAAKQL